jgi:nucleoside-diphosphate-sugar epimerase
MGTITIIGAAGFVGTRLVESLVLGGHTNIRAVVRSYRSFASLSRFGPAITLTLADAESSAALVPALRGSSVVVNVTTGVPASIIRTTKAIHEACVAARVPRLIHLSSAVVYGEVTSPQVADDSAPLTGHWMPYARAKAAAEIWLRERMSSTSLQVAVLRPGIVWGVRSPHTLAAVRALLDKTAYLVDGGKGIFNSIYIDNLVACIRACCAHRGSVTGFYNVADRELLTWRDFYAAFAAPFGYDMARMPVVSARRFPWSAQALVDYLCALPFVSGLYYGLKSRLPDPVKAKVKALLAGHYNYEGHAHKYVTRPLVERELWSLQRVRHKLPAAKIAHRLGFTPPVTFAEGVKKTLRWLEFVGYTPAHRDFSKNGACRCTLEES